MPEKGDYVNSDAETLRHPDSAADKMGGTCQAWLPPELKPRHGGIRARQQHYSTDGLRCGGSGLLRVCVRSDYRYVNT